MLKKIKAILNTEIIPSSPRKKGGGAKAKQSSEGMSGPWVGVDLDGTLAVWDDKSTLNRIGKPVPGMLEFVKRMVNNGIRV